MKYSIWEIFFINTKIFITRKYSQNSDYWVESTLKIDTKKMSIAYVNDPFGKPGSHDENFRELRKIMRDTLE